jgi:DNA-binding PadR family transcriptional regulator
VVRFVRARPGAQVGGLVLPVDGMSSSTRLLVLGVVRIFQPVHGYEVRRELITWRAQEWASVQPGSIYNALKTLTRDGFLEVVGTDQVGGRPERTSYRLTSAGEEEFRILLREEWWTVRTPTDPLMAAVSFIGFVSRAEAIAALEHRKAQIHSVVRGIQFGIDEHDGVDSPFHVREMMRLMNARILAEIEWAQQFITRLKAGEYTTADDPPWQPSSRPAPPASRPRSRGNRGKPSRGNGARPAPIERPVKRAPIERAERADAKRDRNGRGEPVKRARHSGRGRRARAWRGRSDRR